ncbi:hypothetical protein G5V58_17455 [Nocardioides anomalus]|uniref:Uncharacterized protein n=1 Tax=Nocardioides anomalus TaxID=2712223 RepID=A0A6G6WGV6_9ACTN|nr:hypothetical protein [Nocardioides anomalus]QIG44325.1 hypothetical protein G5V58_17455 [Nocardioides anomalus]
MLAPEVDTVQAREERRRQAVLRYRRHVQELLQRREDLAGVSKLADLMSDATRWAA